MRTIVEMRTCRARPKNDDISRPTTSIQVLHTIPLYSTCLFLTIVCIFSSETLLVHVQVRDRRCQIGQAWETNGDRGALWRTWA